MTTSAPAASARLDLAAQVIAAVGGEEQRHGQPVGGRAVRQRVAAEQDLAQQPADRPLARLARRVHAPPARLEVALSRPSWVVVPEPSIPSRTMKRRRWHGP